MAAQFATLGTSRVSPLAATLAGLVLFAAFGATAFARSCALRAECAAVLPDWVGSAVRAAGAAVAVYVAAGAMLTATALAVHHARVEALSHQVGGGWSGVPILLLGVLAAPNAAVAGAAYLAGPGFALGSGSAVSLGSTVHGTLPAFPLLGAVPSGPATIPVWVLAGLTPVAAGVCAARVAGAGAGSDWRSVLRTLGVTSALVALAGLVLAWQAGGAIGSGRLSAFGASPWRFGLAIGGAVAVVAVSTVGVLATVAWLRDRRDRDERRGPALAAVSATTTEVVDANDAGADDEAETGSLAG